MSIDTFRLIARTHGNTIESWGVKYDTHFPISPDGHCPFCLKPLITDTTTWPTYVVGFHKDDKVLPQEGKEGVFVLHCPNCQQHFTLYADFVGIDLCIEHCDRWPKKE